MRAQQEFGNYHRPLQRGLVSVMVPPRSRHPTIPDPLVSSARVYLLTVNVTVMLILE